MIISDEFLKKIKDFGLNSYEARIWAALLSRGVSTAGELSDIANVPRSRSYDILESLEKKGFIIMKLGKPIKYIAVPPEEVVERVKKNIKNQADTKVESLNKLKDSDILGELNVLHKKGVELVDPTDITGAVKGRDNIHDQLNLMLKTAEQSVLLATSDEGVVRKLSILERQFKKAKDRGVTIKIAVPGTKKSAEAIKRLGQYATIKEAKNLNARFCVIDDKEILFMLMSDADVHPTYDVAVWINTPFFAATLTQLFQLAWKEMPPIKN